MLLWVKSDESRQISPNRDHSVVLAALVGSRSLMAVRTGIAELSEELTRK